MSCKTGEGGTKREPGAIESVQKELDEMKQSLSEIHSTLSVLE